MADHSLRDHGKYEMFEARRSDDEVKTDLELTCVLCGAVLCDIEHEDTVAVLMRVIDDHDCEGMARYN